MEQKRKWFQKAMISVGIIILVSLVSVLMYSTGIREENILLVYTFGVLVIIMKTKEYVCGILSSVIMVAVYNYLFTDPKYTFQVNDKNYIVSFLIFLIVAMIVASLVVKVQRQVAELEYTQKVTDSLYKISSGYLNISGLEQSVSYGLGCLESIEKREYIIFLNDRRTDTRIPYGIHGNKVREDVAGAADWSFKKNANCGMGTPDFSRIPYYMIPIVSKGITYGVLAVECEDQPLSAKYKKVLEAVLSVIAVSLDRECTAEAERVSRLLSEREHLRNNLLRSISHDLRTPLAGMTGSASFLLESWNEIDEESRNTLLRDIVNDSVWLSRLVENLLNMTRIQDGRLNLKYMDEVVDDITAEVVPRVERRLCGRKLEIETPHECLTVPMDGRLIIQVLVNLIDNAIKHTPSDGVIRLVVERVPRDRLGGPEYARFSVIDVGTGIDPNVLDHMFDSFVTTDTKGGDSGRGVGLGLNIASEIVRVHQGVIGSFNNKDIGATVYFLLPLERKEVNE